MKSSRRPLDVAFRGDDALVLEQELVGGDGVRLRVVVLDRHAEQTAYDIPWEM